MVESLMVKEIKDELRADRVKEAKRKLKTLMVDEEQAKRILANCQRKIADYLAEIDEKEEDVSV